MAYLKSRKDGSAPDIWLCLSPHLLEKPNGHVQVAGQAGMMLPLGVPGVVVPECLSGALVAGPYGRSIGAEPAILAGTPVFTQKPMRSHRSPRNCAASVAHSRSSRKSIDSVVIGTDLEDRGLPLATRRADGYESRCREGHTVVGLNVLNQIGPGGP